MNKCLLIIFFGILLLDDKHANYSATITERYDETYRMPGKSGTYTRTVENTQEIREKFIPICELTSDIDLKTEPSEIKEEDDKDEK